jgi:hypothetical protein
MDIHRIWFESENPNNTINKNINNEWCNENKIWNIYIYKQFRPKQIAHRLMVLPNVIWPWSIYYSKGQLLKKEN